ncbi:NIPSNAP family protein, partial [Chryseosolibacter indicus]
MQRRDFIKKTAVATGALSAAAVGSATAQQTGKNKELYELRVYELKNQTAMDNYLSKALIPALNRLGVKQVGAFTETGKSEPVKLYVLIPYNSFEDYGRITYALKSDTEFLNASAEYNQTPQDKAVFNRYESSLLLAFDGLPKMIVPPSGQRIFELRTYEGYSEDAVRRKVKMFNEGEFDIFNRVKLNSVFFGEMLAGKNLPCLTYIITFE